MRRLISFFVIASAIVLASTAFAADHTDAPLVTADPASDIADFYTFMNPNDSTEVVFIMTVSPFAGPTAQFSDAIDYVFHLENDNGDTFEIVCTFDASQNVTCDGAGRSVTGPSGMENSDTGIRVWAGLSDDPFFFDLVAFFETVDGAGDGFTDPGENISAGANVLSIVVGLSTVDVTGDGANPVLSTYASTRQSSSM